MARRSVGAGITIAELDKEVAGAEIGGVRSPYAGYPADGLNPAKLAQILRAADEGNPLEYFELAELIEERDPHYLGVMGTRKRVVSQTPMRVEAASEEAEHVRHADMIRAWLARDELQAEVRDMLDAIGKGISFTEIVWETSGRQYRPKRLLHRDPRWFTFSRSDMETPLLRTAEGDVPLPPFKFIVTSIQAKSGLPIRSGLARVATWAWMFKAFTQKDWAIFTQTYGQPIRIGRYDSGATDEQKRTLLSAVTNIAADCAAIIPAGMSIEFVESKGVDHNSAAYRERCDWLDQQISKAVLGQTATTDAIAGGHAVGREHREVQQDIKSADCMELQAVLNRDLVRTWIDLEFGPQELYPRLIIEDPDQTDGKALSETLATLIPLGLKVPASWVADKLGIPEPAAGEDVLSAPPPKATVLPAADPAMQSVAGDDVTDRLADQESGEWERMISPVVRQVEDLLASVSNLEEFRAGLAALANRIDTAALAEALGDAGVAMKLAGLMGVPQDVH